MTRYRVFYNFYNTAHSSGNVRQKSTLLPANRAIADVVHGFWVDANYRYTNGGDAQYFIPAAQLVLISKEDHHEDASRN